MKYKSCLIVLLFTSQRNWKKSCHIKSKIFFLQFLWLVSSKTIRHDSTTHHVHVRQGWNWPIIMLIYLHNKSIIIILYPEDLMTRTMLNKLWNFHRLLLKSGTGYFFIIIPRQAFWCYWLHIVFLLMLKWQCPILAAPASINGSWKFWFSHSTENAHTQSDQKQTFCIKMRTSFPFLL